MPLTAAATAAPALLVLVLMVSVVTCMDPESQCASHFAGGKPPTNLNVHSPYATCHWKDDRVFFYNIYDEAVLHGVVTVHRINHTLLPNCTGGRRGFTEDPQLKQLGVKQPSPENPNTGYGAIWNRGHLGPNQVFSFDKSKEGAWAQCYYADNIAPQDFQFNQIGWRLLEANVFNYAQKTQRDVYVITGTWYNASLVRRIGVQLSPNATKIRTLNSGIGIPDYYYKVICDGDQSAAFAGQNELHHSGMESLEFMSVRWWEKQTGIEFNLPASCKPGTVEPRHWNFTHSPPAHLENIFGSFKRFHE